MSGNLEKRPRIAVATRSSVSGRRDPPPRVWERSGDGGSRHARPMERFWTYIDGERALAISSFDPGRDDLRRPDHENTSGTGRSSCGRCERIGVARVEEHRYAAGVPEDRRTGELPGTRRADERGEGTSRCRPGRTGCPRSGRAADRLETLRRRLAVPGADPGGVERDLGGCDLDRPSEERRRLGGMARERGGRVAPDHPGRDAAHRRAPPNSRLPRVRPACVPPEVDACHTSPAVTPCASSWSTSSRYAATKPIAPLFWVRPGVGRREW